MSNPETPKYIATDEQKVQVYDKISEVMKEVLGIDNSKNM